MLEVQKTLIKECAEKLSLNILYRKMLFLLGQHLRSEKVLNRTISNSSEMNEVGIQISVDRIELTNSTKKFSTNFLEFLILDR